jgi:hypothetical protein
MGPGGTFVMPGLELVSRPTVPAVVDGAHLGGVRRA